MIRIFISIIAISFFIYQSEYDKYSEDELHWKVKTFLNLDSPEDAEPILNYLIRKYPDSNSIDDYYEFLDMIYFKELHKYPKVDYSKQTFSHKKEVGKINTTWVYRGPSPEDSINAKRVVLAGMYLANEKNKKHRTHFLLSTLMNGKDTSVSRQIATELISLDNKQAKEEGFKFISLLEHAEGNYTLARNYYSKEIAITEDKDSIKLAGIHLAIADCYYMEGNISEALKQLTIVKKYKRDVLKNTVEIWEECYRKVKKNPSMEREKNFYIEFDSSH